MATDPILDRLRAGDPDGLELAYCEHGRLVGGVCRRILGDGAAADDAAQAVFLLLWQRAGRLPEGTVLAGWCYRAARLAALARRREDERRRRRERVAMSAPDAGSPPEPELLHQLDQALARLPERQRLSIVLVHLEGRPREEAAAAIGISEVNLRRCLSDGIEALRRRFGGRRGAIAGAAVVALLARAEAGETSGAGAVADMVTRIRAGAAPAASSSVADLARAAASTPMLPWLAVALALSALLFTAAWWEWAHPPIEMPEAGLAVPAAAREMTAPAQRTTLPDGPPTMLGRAQPAHPGGGRIVLWSRNRWGNYPLATFAFDLGLRGDHPDVRNRVDLVFGNRQRTGSFAGKPIDAVPEAESSSGAAGMSGSVPDERDEFQVGLVGGRRGAIRDLGAVDYAAVDHAEPIDFGAPPAAVAVGHTYLVRYRDDERDSRYLKIHILAHRDNDAVLIEWAPLPPPPSPVPTAID